MPWRAKPILSIGDLVVDLVMTIPSLPVEADRVQIASSLFIEPGGAGNFLIAGSRLGMKMSALGVIGRDVFGDAIVSALEAEQVDLSSLIRQPGGSTTAVVVLVDRVGRHTFLGKYGEGPVVSFNEGWRRAVEAAGVVFSCGYVLQEKRLADACLEALEHASRSGVPTFFDPGPDMALASDEQRQWAVAASRVLLMTEEEIPYMTGGQEGIGAAAQLLGRGPQVVCIKRGGLGCLILTPEGEVEHPGFPVSVRDTTAAGDAFDAAFIAAYLLGWSLHDVAVFANAMGAAKVRKMGSGGRVPTAEEVQAVLDEFETGLRVEGSTHDLPHRSSEHREKGDLTRGEDTWLRRS
ncbi:MAG: carbohydrate kinase family protein [Chloroflexi bacterium]|nr:carbohydrate kinase family protein [Chloroflexota bacterium]